MSRRKPRFGWQMTGFFQPVKRLLYRLYTCRTCRKVMFNNVGITTINHPFLMVYTTHLWLYPHYWKLVFPTHHCVSSPRPLLLLLSPSVPHFSLLALPTYLHQISLYQPHLSPTYCISVLISIAVCLPPSLSTKLIPIKNFYSIMPNFIKLISPIFSSLNTIDQTQLCLIFI